jgi:hypothetical protein
VKEGGERRGKGTTRSIRDTMGEEAPFITLGWPFEIHMLRIMKFNLNLILKAMAGTRLCSTNVSMKHLLR